MKKIVRLTESDLNRIVKRTIIEMEMDTEIEMEVERDPIKDVKSAIESYMQSIANKDPQYQREKIMELINVDLKPYLASLEGMRKVGGM
jgi:anaerobic ribonucleoside-triphosphate reductase